ncbi:MAG: hypothetical protein JWM93_3323 [Frankiales bacterium]|nr:hypothetical protein [Frankiales bacterium]
MALTGMDIEAVNGLGQQLKTQAEALNAIIGEIDGLVRHAQDVWKGNDATQFAGWWQDQHRPALQHAREAIDGLGQSALNNASEQAQVSGH